MVYSVGAHIMGSYTFRNYFDFKFQVKYSWPMYNFKINVKTPVSISLLQYLKLC